MMMNEEMLVRVKIILEAVGFIGVDFGYGEYFLSPCQIREAQDLFIELETKDE